MATTNAGSEIVVGAVGRRVMDEGCLLVEHGKIAGAGAGLADRTACATTEAAWHNEQVLSAEP